jgi:hypothetical protein
VKHRIYENVLTIGLKDLKTLLDGIIAEEKKMNETLKKFKRENENSINNLSDYEKMLV